MADRRALASIGGRTSEIPAGDALLLPALAAPGSTIAVNRLFGVGGVLYFDTGSALVPVSALGARANHTGTQLAATISDFTAAARAAAVANSISDAVNDIAPSQNAVFDALALKANLASPNFSGTPQIASSNILKASDIGSTVQAQDAELAAIAGLTSAADRLPYFNGSGTATLATFTAAGRALLDDADAAAQRVTLSLGNVDNTSDANKPVSSATQTVLNLKANLASPNFSGTPQIGGSNILKASDIGTTVQAQDATLAALAGANWAANSLAVGTGTDTVGQVTFAANTIPGRSSSGNLVAKTVTDFGFSLLDDADASAARTTLGLVIGTNVQAFDATLAAFAGLTIAAESLSVGTGTDAFTQVTFAANKFPARGSTGSLVAKDISDAALTLVAQTSQANLRTTGLGATTVGASLFTLANPSAITFPKINADNTVSAESAATHRTSVGLGNVDNTSDANKPVSTATQTALDLKANLASPNFSGTPQISSSNILKASDIGSTVQGYDADTAAIAALSPSNDDLLQRKAGAWTNRTPSQVKTDLALVKADVGLGNVDNTSDANKPVSTATQTALDLKANLASPNFSGTPQISSSNILKASDIGSTVQGYDADTAAIAALLPSNDDLLQRKAGAWTNRTPSQVKTDLALVKADVGLGNVDNTSDANKPVSTATQTALDLKANLASPVFTGVLTNDVSKSKHQALGNVSGTVDLDLSVASHFSFTMTGNVTLTISNLPASGFKTEFTLAIKDGLTYTLSYPFSVRWENGAPPELNNAEWYLKFLVDNGANINGWVLIAAAA